MKNNTFKRVLAGSLALLTVAAYVPANVGGILPDLSIVASAEAATYYNEKSDYVQDGGLLRFTEDSVAFVEGVYEITVDAGKHVYTKVSGTDVYTLKEGKAYVLRTTAFVQGTAGTIEYADKNLDGEDLPAGVYEYKIKTVSKTDTLSVDTLKNAVQVNATDFAEGIKVMQNGKEIIYKDGAYQVAQGYPVEVTATPGEVHTNQMLSVAAGDDEAAPTVKSQSKSNGSVTLTFVPEQTADKINTGKFVDNTTTTLTWADYTPTLQLTNDNGTIRATDVGFNALVSNAVVGTYEFKYGYTEKGAAVAAETNAKGEYIADTKSEASAAFTAKKVTIDNATYDFVKQGTTTYQYKDKDGQWQDITAESEVKDTKGAGKYRAITTVVAETYTVKDESGTDVAVPTCALSENPFKIITEFTVVAQNVTSTKNLVFVAKDAAGVADQRIDPNNGVYNVPWQNGKEITPNLILFKDVNDAAKVTTSNVDTYVEAEDSANKNVENTDSTYWLEGKDKDFTVTGTTTASEAGTYTMTITPTKKAGVAAFNDGEEITITWQIVNTNNYVVAKKNPTGLSDKVADTSNTDAKESARANAQNFNIGYRQANNKSIVEKITKSLDFVGSQDLTVVEYRKVTYAYSADASGKVKATATIDKTTAGVVDDPSEKAGTYVALVANALKNDGKTSAMMKDNQVYDPDGAEKTVEGVTTGNVFEAGDLYPVYFQVTPTRVRIVPDVTEITYGDKVALSKLYTVIDADTKEKIGVPWASGKEPKFVLKDKYSEKVLPNAATETETLPAGEYVYGIEDNVEVLDSDNYDVKELIAEDQTDFTVNPRDLSEMDFGTVGVEVKDGDANVVITKLLLAEAANAIEANPVDFAYTYPSSYTYNEETEKANRVSTNDFNISGGTTSAKVADLGKTFTVTIKGVKNFTGSKTVSWVVGGDALSDDILTYEAEFDASKPRVMAKFDITKVDGEIAECGFYYNNNGKMNDTPLATAQNQKDAQELFKQVDQSGANMNQKGSKKVGFSATALSKAQSGNGLLTAEIANSSVLKQVYIMPYVKYKNGNIAYGKVESFNYYDMVLNAEGALEVTKTDFVGDGKTGTAGQTYVKVDVTRVDKKGYEVQRYGILYNNSDSWNQTTQNTQAKKNDAERALANTWLNLDYESEKTVKVAEVPAEDLAKKIGTNTYIANTTAKAYKGEKNEKDLGYGEKTVLAKAFIVIKDAAGNTKPYYSNLADVTYGGFTVDEATGAVNDLEATKAVTDSKNTTQILFYAPNTSGLDDYAMTRMAASTGDKTFAKWFEEQKKNK